MKWQKTLAWGALALSVANTLRGHLAWQVAPVLTGQVSVSLPAMGAWYLGWGVLWAGLGLLLLHGKALRAVLPVAVSYQVTAWVLRVGWDRSDYARALWERDALLSALFLAVTLALVRAVQRARHPSQSEANISAT